MDDPAKDFGSIRVWGTIGWIVAGLLISYAFSWDAKEAIAGGALKNTFMMAAGASALLGLFSFSLPKTPPKTSEGEKVSIRDILGAGGNCLIKRPQFSGLFPVVHPHLHPAGILLSAG